ncbi:MAG: hypothetical protein MZV70_34230 [Desulfobacterales bacterium]|nr:hypothetical protein [Desulfobacterales bacterium]
MSLSHLRPGQRVTASSRRPTAMVENGRVTDEVEFLHRHRGGGARHRPGQRRRSTRRASFVEPLMSRRGWRRVHAWSRRTRSSCMDVSPNQLVSVAAVADPLPGARRRQPRPHGLEHAAPGGPAADDRGAPGRHRHGGRGGQGLRASPSSRRRDGEVVERGCLAHRRQATTPTGEPDETSVDIYNLIKYQRSNQNTCFNQKPDRRKGRAGRKAARSSPTGRPPTRASWRWART